MSQLVERRADKQSLYTFVVSRAFMAGATSQTGDADSSRAPVLTSGMVCRGP